MLRAGLPKSCLIAGSWVDLVDHPLAAGVGGHMTQIMDRITVDPEQCGGRPCIRGMRIRVTDVLDLLAAGLTSEQVLDEMPALEAEDIEACLRFASRKLNHPIVAA